MKARELLRFRTRSPDRDRQTDQSRLERLRKMLTDLSDELSNEKAGFQRRYEAASSDAAFSQQAYEDGRTGDGMSVRIDDLTASLINYTNRIAGIDRQLAFIAQMLVEVDTFEVEEKAFGDSVR